MPDMSLWDADQPGTTREWWVQRGTCVPSFAKNQFDTFLHALGEYNNALPHADHKVHEVALQAGRLIDALRTGGMNAAARPQVPKPNYGPSDRLRGLKMARDQVKTTAQRGLQQFKPDANPMSMRQRVGAVMPSLKSSRGPKGPTDNLELGLNNLCESLGVAAVPKAYDI